MIDHRDSPFNVTIKTKRRYKCSCIHLMINYDFDIMEVKDGRCVETIKFKRLDSTYISLLRNFIRRLYIIKRGWSCLGLLPSFFFTLILFSAKWTVLLSLEFRDDDSVIKKKARCGYEPFVRKFFKKLRPRNICIFL